MRVAERQLIFIAHVMKHTKASCGQMFSHYDRKKGNFSNENIDKTKTHLNYNLATHQEMSQGEFVKQRCSEVRMQNRKDINIMCSWVITTPKGLEEKDHKKFFEESYKFLEKRYGKDNVISSWVHNDEITPHMHFAFVPVVEDQKKGGYKVSAKEAVTRVDLKSFHPDLEEHLTKQFGRVLGVLNENTKEGNLSIEELKRKSAKERLDEVNIEASEIVSKAQLKAEGIETSIIPLKAEYEAKKAFIRKCDDVSEVSKAMPDYVEIKKSIFTRKEYVVVPKDKWVAKYVSANEKEYLRNARQALEKQINNFKKAASYENLRSLENQVNELKNDLRTVKKENQILKNKTEKFVNKLNKVLEKFPEEISKAFIKMWNVLERQQSQDREIER